MKYIELYPKRREAGNGDPKVPISGLPALSHTNGAAALCHPTILPICSRSSKMSSHLARKTLAAVAEPAAMPVSSAWA